MFFETAFLWLQDAIVKLKWDGKTNRAFMNFFYVLDIFVFDVQATVYNGGR